MKIQNILLIYKRSAYQIYSPGQITFPFRTIGAIPRSLISRFKEAHHDHYKSLTYVENVLKDLNLKYQKYRRGSKIDYRTFDFVISVGGDGTFLEAARGIKKQIILGVNSDPARSVGRFCAANKENFQKIMIRILNGKIKSRELYRMRLKTDHIPYINVLNDILICHKNPAAMSRYALTVNGLKEEQRSSGLWIATSAGSSGAILSAGGKPIDPKSKTIQYLPRELHLSPQKRPKNLGGIARMQAPIQVQSLMRNGMIYVDGSHLYFPFGFGSTARITHSSDTLQMI